MDNFTIDRIKHTMNTDVVRRLLIKYFRSKPGFEETLSRKVFPPILQDLTLVIPQLVTKVEIEPYCEEIDNNTGKAILGWQLFVLGNHRCFLGNTYHNDLSMLARQLQAGSIMIPEDQQGSARRQATARQIILFITRVLSKNEAGYVDLSVPQQSQNSSAPNVFGQVGMSNGSFYSRMGSGGGMI